jgi:hypothetical protein
MMGGMGMKDGKPSRLIKGISGIAGQSTVIVGGMPVWSITIIGGIALEFGSITITGTP